MNGKIVGWIIAGLGAATITVIGWVGSSVQNRLDRLESAAARVSVLEAQRVEDSARLARIETKIDGIVAHLPR